MAVMSIDHHPLCIRQSKGALPCDHHLFLGYGEVLQQFGTTVVLEYRTKLNTLVVYFQRTNYQLTIGNLRGVSVWVKNWILFRVNGFFYPYVVPAKVHFNCPLSTIDQRYVNFRDVRDELALLVMVVTGLSSVLIFMGQFRPHWDAELQLSRLWELIKYDHLNLSYATIASVEVLIFLVNLIN